jgi:hypothetical protein
VRVLTKVADGRRKVPNVEPGKEVAVAAGFEVTYMGRLGRLAVSPGLLMRLLPEVRRAVDRRASHRGLLVCHDADAAGVPVDGQAARMVATRRPSALARKRSNALRRNAEATVGSSLPDRCATLHLTSEIERAESLRHFPNFSTAVIANGVRVPDIVSHTTADGILPLG